MLSTPFVLSFFVISRPWLMVPASSLCRLMNQSSLSRPPCLCPTSPFVCGMLVNLSFVPSVVKPVTCLRLALSRAGAYAVNSQVTGLGIASRPGARPTPARLLFCLLHRLPSRPLFRPLSLLRLYHHFRSALPTRFHPAL